jgi:hypothetical protein
MSFLIILRPKCFLLSCPLMHILNSFKICYPTFLVFSMEDWSGYFFCFTAKNIYNRVLKKCPLVCETNESIKKLTKIRYGNISFFHVLSQLI